jgi:hypothetical protein
LTKDLNYEVFLNPGKYILVFDVKDKKTTVSKLISIDLTISTLNMTGWYLLKDDGNKTDFDFIYDGGRIDNWIANYNDGRSLEGKAIKGVFSSQFKMSPSSTDIFNVISAVTEKDAVICDIASGKIVMDIDNMFFQKPDIINIQDIVQPVAYQYLYLTNNNKVYNLTKGALFANPPVSTFKISPVSGVASVMITFDESTKSVVVINNGGGYSGTTSANELKNMNADLVWVGGWAGLRNVAALLFRRNTGEGFLVRTNTSTAQIQASKTVSATHGLMSADKIGGNYDSDYFYYAKANKIYMTDLASLPESLQITLPAGETVTCMQHIKFPQPSSGVVNKVNSFAIASYVNGRYKVWIHEISSTGELRPVSQPSFEGNGRVATITYMEQGEGSRLY